MDFKEINLLLTVERVGKISQAADILGLSQPALSKAIKQIEKKLDARLFMRLPRGVKPTKYGEVYLKSYKKILTIMENTEKKVSALKSDYSQSIKISIHPILGDNLIPKIEKELILYPEIRLKYIFMESREGIQDVLNGNVDCAIVADPYDYPDLVKKTLWKEYVALYSKDAKIKETVLYNSKMISANKLLKIINFERSRAIDNYWIIHSLLKNNDFMALLPNSMVKDDDPIERIKKFSPLIEVSLVYRSDQNKTKSFSKVISTISDCSKN